jgi:ribosomal protein RSM22 (predicted rRNA methylase)
MELPPSLRQAVERALEGVPLHALREAAASLSQRYRSETRDGRLHMADALDVSAYLATRLPATYAAIRASMDAASGALPGFQPRSLLDIGAGPGTALWAATDCWQEIANAMLIEASAAVRQTGVVLASAAPLPSIEWIAADVAAAFPEVRPADLVTICYVLDELRPDDIGHVVERAWNATGGLLLVVEPGTPAGWRRILDVRRRLLALGAHLAAPCGHQAACPITAPDWCHFSQRVARSRVHRLAKSGDAPWEDEKFVYLAASRLPADAARSRVLAPPRKASGRITLKLCGPDGAAGELALSKRDGHIYRTARRLAWGDAAALRNRIC